MSASLSVRPGADTHPNPVAIQVPQFPSPSEAIETVAKAVNTASPHVVVTTPQPPTRAIAEPSQPPHVVEMVADSRLWAKAAAVAVQVLQMVEMVPVMTSAVTVPVAVAVHDPQDDVTAPGMTSAVTVPAAVAVQAPQVVVTAPLVLRTALAVALHVPQLEAMIPTAWPSVVAIAVEVHVPQLVTIVALRLSNVLAVATHVPHDWVTVP